MTRLFTDVKLIKGENLSLSEDESRYLSQVLRMREGNIVTVVDSDLFEAECEILSIEKKKVVLNIGDVRENMSESPCRITLFQSVSKGERMDLTIQKSTELGVYAIAPVFSERCVVRFNESDSSGKIDRWQKIAEEAARQSGRGLVPKILPSLSFADAVKKASSEFDLCLMPWEEEKGKTLKEMLKDFKAEKGKTVAVFIGPEGGYSEEEAKLASDSGIASVTLGKRILRTETAGPSVLSMLLYEFEL